MPVSSSSKANTPGSNPSLNVRAPAPGKPRFQRKKAPQAARGEGGGGSIKIELVSDADFCHQLLVDGFVQSYVDFYHLTHRADPNQGEGSTAKIRTPFGDMVLLRDNLTAAENCRRSGNTPGVYKAYTALTDVYVKKADWKTAIFFQEKCLEVAQLTSDKKAELDAIHSLGCVYQRMRDFSTARTLHERQEDLASMHDDAKEVGRANGELYRVYEHFGKTAEAANSIEEALSMYQKCIDAAAKSENDRGTATANGLIGNIYVAQAAYQEGVQYLQEWMRISTDLGDAEGRCSAHSALALAYDHLGRNEKALQELAMVHSISLQTGDAGLQSQAARSLGMLYAKVGDLSKSVVSMEQHFNLLKIIAAKRAEKGNEAGPDSGEGGDVSGTGGEGGDMSGTGAVDLARAFVGIAKGNLFLDRYAHAVKNDGGLLLDWKLNRTALGQEGYVLAAEEEAIKLAAQKHEEEEEAVRAQEAEEAALLAGGGNLDDESVYSPRADVNAEAEAGADTEATEEPVPGPEPAAEA